MAKHERGLRFQPTGGSKAPQIPTGKKQRLTIERLANDGRGIAFFEGRTWFVIGALAARNNINDLWTIVAFGAVGYLFEKFRFPIAPMVLDLISDWIRTRFQTAKGPASK